MCQCFCILFLFCNVYNTIFMAFTPLDAPLNDGGLKIRETHTAAIEWILIGFNMLMLILLWWSVVGAWWRSGVGAISSVILFLGTLSLLVPVQHLLYWRRASVAYEETGALELLNRASGGFAHLLSMLSLLVWGLYSLMLLSILFDKEGIELWRYALLLGPSIILGPFQFFYLRKLRRLRRDVFIHETGTVPPM